jgi:hypothetical protein
VKKLAGIIIFVLSAFMSEAQWHDTLHEVFKYKSSIDARLESRYSFINNEIVSVTGVRLGVAFQRKLRIGGGISWLKSDYKITFYPINIFGRKDTVQRYLKFAYLCFYLDFVFYKTKRWQLSVPIQMGLGSLWFQRKTAYNIFGADRKYFLALYEPGITAQFKVFKWIGLGADVAYRFSAKDNVKIRQDLDIDHTKYKVLAWSPTYSFKLLIWFDQLYYQVFPNSKITKRFGPAVW